MSLTLRDVASLPVGGSVGLGANGGDGLRTEVAVTVGDLVVDTRSDGVEILSAANAVTATSIAGTLVVEERSGEGIAGTFQADLDDGGHLEGHFAAIMTE